VTVCSRLRDAPWRFRRRDCGRSSPAPGDDETGAEPFDGFVAERDDLREVVPGVDVHDRERQPRRRERLGRGVRHDDAVLTSRKEQHRPLELGRDLTQEVDRLGFERRQVRGNLPR
jgi:hypothetical protein